MRQKSKIVYCEKCGFYLGEYYPDNNRIYRFGISYEVKNGKIRCGNCGHIQEIKRYEQV